jgi:large subunit ribosomal protein L17
MRHRDKVKKLNRTKSHREALLKNLALALFIHESIKTTKAKAMALKSYADRLITLAKRKELNSVRMAFSLLRNKEVVKKLFNDIGERYKDVQGGYTRVLNMGNRKGDCAPMALIELTRKREKKVEEKS